MTDSWKRECGRGLIKELSSLEESINAGNNDDMGMPVFIALSEMLKRASMNLVDKVAGWLIFCRQMKYRNTLRHNLRRMHGPHWSTS